ncbi:site-specific integrase [Deinococcus sp. NW-56]|uniref:tyrosine-type recombinase/integrase n=1 Tax=Deinococcus sp. NW-56 TaxID=2080419 RepID=UPI00131A3730|nr:site-specific integrase [Deinococcus sp. NW-56]
MTKQRDTTKNKRSTKQRGNGEGTVYRSGDKWRWQVTLGYRANGSRVTASGTAPTKSAANTARAQALVDHSRGLLAEPSEVTVAQYAQKWLMRHTHVNARTAELYRQELDYALEYLGNMRVRDVRATHIKDLMAVLSRREMKGGRGLGRAMASRTQGKVLTRLRALFKEAVSDQIIYANPMEGVRRLKGSAPEAVGRVLDFDQAARFRELGEALHTAGLCRLWPALFTALSVGLRRGEVMGLAWDCVDFDRGVLRIRRQLVQSKGGVKLEEELKTKASRRDVHMPDSLRVALLAHRERQHAERRRMGSAWIETNAVFATELGNWTSPDNLNRALESVIAWSRPGKGKTGQGGVGAAKLARLQALVGEEGGLPDLTPHDLRHTFATLALRLKVPVEVVSKKLGHARVSITLDIYRHVLDNEQREHAVDVFAPSSPPPPVQASTPALLN